MASERKKPDTSSEPDKTNRYKPVDVIDGIPGRSSKAYPWKYLAIAAVFLAWIGFLVICGIVGTL